MKVVGGRMGLEGRWCEMREAPSNLLARWAWRERHGGRGMERHGERNIMRESVTAQPAGVLTCINNMPAYKLSTWAAHLEKYG